MEEIKMAGAKEIHQSARYILKDGLSGIPKPCPAFDLGRVDYRIDNLDVRLQQITESIVKLALNALLPKVEQLVETRVREKIRKSI